MRPPDVCGQLGLALVVILASTAFEAVGLEVGSDQSHCQDIRVPLCQSLPYNQTVMPNLMGNANQQDAQNDINQYKYHMLVKLGCSKDIRFFICAMFTPVCTIIKKALPPCRELCESAKAGCEQVLYQFNVPWPPQFDCAQFPRFGQGGENLCVGEANQGSFTSTELKDHQTTTLRPGRPSHFDQLMDFVCPAALQVPPEYEYSLSFGRGSHQFIQGSSRHSLPSSTKGDVQGRHLVEDCGAPCSEKLFFGLNNVYQMRLWVGIWAVVCLASTVFTLATFLVDSGRFPYPEKPIVYLAMCYLVVALVYLIGFGSGDAVACNQPFASNVNGLRTESVLKQGTLHDWRCSILGMLLYFFVTAGSVWWVVLTLAWFLSAGLKWGQESIDVIASYFHAVVWTLASLQTILVLILKKIEGDMLSGVCYVGLLDDSSLLYLIVVPSAVYLTVGLVFLVMGFASLAQVRTVMKRDGTRTDKLERLMLRIGTFSLLYMVPASTVLGCYLYEYIHLPDWMLLWQEEVCRDKTLQQKWHVGCRFPDNQQPQVAPPNFFVFMLKYVMIFAVGIFSGFWVWSGKTVQTWKNFYAKMCGGYRREANV